MFSWDCALSSETNPSPFPGSAKKEPRGNDESSRSRPVIDTWLVGTSVITGGVVAVAPACTQPRSTQKLLFAVDLKVLTLHSHTCHRYSDFAAIFASHYRKYLRLKLFAIQNRLVLRKQISVQLVIGRFDLE